MKINFYTFFNFIIFLLFLILPNSIVAQNDIYSIPTVVHVIYTDSTDTNISDAQINSAINALNDDFRKVAGSQGDGLGEDTEIEFCLAQRAPDGSATTGINRIKCVGTCSSDYEDIGFDSDINEDQVKGLSYWNNEEYYNIWIVHKFSGSLEGEKGFTPLTGGNPYLDGSVILYSAFGIGSQFDVLEMATDSNRTITHHAGHFLDLLNTYEGDEEGTVCPDNDSCINEGDKCCDTPPHIRSDSTCIQNMICGAEAPIKNYMDNSTEQCKSEFTNDQKYRMRYNLEGPRKCLLLSLGCKPPCSSLTSDFEVGVTSGNMPIVSTFNNLSTPKANISDYVWHVDCQEVSSDEELIYEFDHYGMFEICLDVIDASTNCYVRNCEIVTISPSISCENTACELLPNVGFENTTGLITQPNNPASETIIPIDDWDEIGSGTPWYCNETEGIHLGGLFLKNNTFSERIETDAFDFIQGVNTYSISFDYSVQKYLNTTTDLDPMNVRVEVISNNLNGGGSASFIAWIRDVEFNYPSSAGYYADSEYFCYPHLYDDQNPNIDFTQEWSTYCGQFTFAASPGFQYAIRLTGESNSSDQHIVYYDNVSIDYCPELCEGTPDFSFNTNDCDISFNAGSTATENIANYSWDFGDGSPVVSGNNPTHTFGWEGTFEVCLTMDCGSEEKIFCKDVYIDSTPDCEECNERFGEFSSQQCGEDNYNSQIVITIPSGYNLCKDDNQAIWSEDGDIDVLSAYVDSENDTKLNLSVEIDPNDPNFVGSLPFYITLCDDNGQTICFNYSVGFSGFECRNCDSNTIEVTATCDASRTGQGEYVYTGSLPIAPPAGFTLCDGLNPEPSGSTSSEAGFEIDAVSSNNINFSIATEKDHPFATTGVLVFCGMQGNELVQMCFPYEIKVNEVCPKIRSQNRNNLSESDFLNESGFKIVNNPASNSLFLEFEKETNSSGVVRIMNSTGSEVLSNFIPNQRLKMDIDISGLSNGIYFVSYSTENGYIETKKVMIIN